jgi:thiamine biosynthesis lipoprotein
MRLPFVTASIIPFLIGAAYVFRAEHISIFNTRFLLGLLAAVSGHIGANILNDYFDSKSGNDWQDRRKHIFFGGSKVIQDGLMSEREVFRAGASFIALSAMCIMALQIMIPNIPIIVFGLFILILAYSYTAPPLKLVYRGWGELVIFVLFGTAIVAGAYTLLTARYFGFQEVLLSFPIAFLVTAILYVNEVPDCQVDKRSGKNNLVVRIGPEGAWRGYLMLIAGAFISIIVCVIKNILPVSSLLTLPIFIIYFDAISILKRECRNLERLKVASVRTIAGHMLVGIGLATTLAFSGPGRAPLEEYNQTRPYMGAYVTIRCFFDKNTDIEPVIKRCWDRMDEIQRDMNAFSDTGDVALINSLGIKGVGVHRSTYDIIDKTLDLSRKTEGAFDITVGPLVKLWKDAARNKRMPDEKELADARNKVGYKNIILTPPNHLRFAKEGARIDLGGVASGYACDEIAGILKSGGIEHFMVDTGGEILCCGLEKGRKPWMIGIQDPFNKNAVTGEIAVKNKCVSTSGSYEKYFVIGDEKLSHIINPITGMPEKNVMSATVIAPTGTEADVLSTAMCVLGTERGIAVARKMKGVEAMLIEKRGEKFIRRQTRGFGN